MASKGGAVGRSGTRSTMTSSGAGATTKPSIATMSTMSSSRRGDGEKGNLPGGGMTIVFKGRDVTPQTLLTAKPQESQESSRRSSLPQAAGAAGAPASGTGDGVNHLSSGLSRSGLSISSSTSHMDSDDDTGFDMPASVPDASADRAVEADVEEERVVLPTLSEAELSAPVTLSLSESETFTLFSLPSLRVLQDTEEFHKVTARNEAYTQLVQLLSRGGDNYSGRHSQTVNSAQKNKEVTAAAALTRDASCTAASWDIHDSLHTESSWGGGDADADIVGGGAGGKDAAAAARAEESSKRESMTEVERAVDEAVAASVGSPGCLLDVEGSVFISAPQAWEDPTHSVPVIARRTQARAGGGREKSLGATSSSLQSSAVGVSRSIAVSSGGSGLPDSGTGGLKKRTTSTASTSESKGARSGGVAAVSTRRSDGGSSNSRNNTNTSGTHSSGSGAGGASGPTRQGIKIPVKPTKKDGAAAGSSEWADLSDTKDVLSAREVARLMTSRSLLQALSTVERALHQNLYHSAHRMYRAVPGAELHIADVGASGPSGDGAVAGAGGGTASASELADRPRYQLQKLWSYHCSQTRGLVVTGMAWNRINKDLLAVAYAQQSKEEDAGGGLVLFWSMTNPEFPQQTLRTKSGVTSIEFSTEHPNVLAAGLYDGSVCIYDAKKALAGESDGSPELVVHPIDGGHSDAVWQVKWVDKGQGRGERLVSISADGRVTEWSTKKGLSGVDLMRLKRVRATEATEDKSDGMISRADPGLCLDFPTHDTSIYYAGTEDGMVHYCSVSYNEQYLESFKAHNGPVYRLRLSPFLPNALLTCSADWSVKLWDLGSASTPTVFQTNSASDAANDVAWSGQTSTRFASVTGDGMVMVWDTTSLAPLISHPVVDVAADGTPQPRRLTSVLFANDAPVLVTGDAAGNVDVYRLLGLPLGPPTIDEQIEALAKSLHPT